MGPCPPPSARDFGVRRIAAFAEGVLQGNPAGVAIVDAFPPEAVMQRVAAEVGFSETAFVARPGSGSGPFAIRFFTPTVEVELCGHATLAAAFVVAGGNHRPGAGASGSGSVSLAFQAPADLLEARVGGTDAGPPVRLRFPADPPGPPIEGAEHGRLLAALGLRSVVSLRRTRFDLLVELATERKVTHYQADFADLESIEARGIVVTAAADPGADYDFVSRFFAPRCGIAEDPVTGSAHAALAPFWSRRLGRRSLLGYQASDRGGLVHARLDDDDAARVWIGGSCREFR